MLRYTYFARLVVNEMYCVYSAVRSGDIQCKVVFVLTGLIQLEEGLNSSLT